jgi:hypothetical protein
MRVERFLGLLGTTALTAVCLFGCGGYGGSSSTPAPTPPTSVTITPGSASVAANGGTQGFTAMVGNDYLSRGVTWSLSGTGCTGATCGSLTAMTSSTVTFNAPAAVPSPAAVTLTATSINDSAKSASAMITVTAALPQAAAPVSLTITDTPAAGIALLSFEVTLTGATLNPGSVDLLNGKGPMQIEVKRLETESVFLTTASVPPGTFTSLTLTFANPELTFKNQAGTTLAQCAPAAVCEIKPMGALTSTTNFPGPGLLILANSPTAIQVDVNPNTILSGALGVDFTLAGAVSVQELTMKPTGELDDLDDLRGAVQNLDSADKRFTLHTPEGDLPITTDGKTRFEFEECAAENFTCLQNNQAIEVEAELMADGAFLARKLEFEGEAQGDELEGIVVEVDDAMHFQMVVLDKLRSVNNVSAGNPIVVTLNAARFQVKADGLQLPSRLQGNFEGATDTSQLLPGQMVGIRLAEAANPGPPVTVTANRVRLRTTQFTANVKTGSVAPPNFSVDMLPALFTGNNVRSIHVQTSSDTDFEAASGVSGLADGNTLSLRGLLFTNGTLPPELVTKKVRKR